MVNLSSYLDSEILEYFNSEKIDLSNIDVDVENPAVDIHQIAEELKVKVEYKYLFSNLGSYDSETRTIVINSFDPEYRQRFTLAHELGHMLLGHEGTSFRKEESQNQKESIEYIVKERQANSFAANLLMPEKLLREVISSNSFDNATQRNRFLAEKFNVSYMAMEYRLTRLGI